MPIKALFLTFILLLSFVYSSQAQAEQCPIRLKFGLLISPDHIRIMEMGRTQMQINNDSELFIRGELITLTDQERYLLQEFSLGLRKELPEIVAIAMDSLDIGFDALNKVIKGFAGTDAAAEIEDHFMELRFGLLKRFARSGDNFYIAPQGLNELDDFFTDKLSGQISNVVTDSMSVMLGAMGEAYRQSEGLVEGQVYDVNESVEKLSASVEKSLAFNANRLAGQAAKFCERFESLDRTEARLQNQIPELRKYDILSRQ